MNIERECDVAETTILWISPDLKPQFPTHFQHHGIFLKDLAVYPFQALGFGVLDDQLHQSPTQACESISYSIPAKDGSRSCVRATDNKNLPMINIDHESRKSEWQSVPITGVTVTRSKL
jgi:hypothetical protein